MFLLVSSYAFEEHFLCFVQGNGKLAKEIENKHLSITKKLAEFYNQFLLLTVFFELFLLLQFH